MSQVLIDAFRNTTPMTIQVNALVAATGMLATASYQRAAVLAAITDHLKQVMPQDHAVVTAVSDTAGRLLASLKRQSGAQLSAIADNTVGATLRDELLRDVVLAEAVYQVVNGTANAGAATQPAAMPTGPIQLLDAMKPVINSALTGATGGKLTDIEPLIAAFVNQATIMQQIAGQKAEVEKAKEEVVQVQGEVNSLRAMLAAAAKPSMPTSLPADGPMPGCQVVMKPAAEVFFPGKRVSAVLNFDIATLQWDAPNPYLPPTDPFYEFDIERLTRVLTAFEEGDRVVCTGHTGTGKTTFLEQVAARTGFLFERINLDSGIGRLDLLGRDTLTENAQGNTVSRFVDGILVKAIQKPCILDLDEVDFIQPDVMPIFYRVTEKPGGLILNEDGGRFITPHPLNRIAIAANTKLAGDESGAYVGTKAQPLAVRARFATWVEFDYLPPEQEERIINNKAPGVASKTVKTLLTLAKLVRDAFTEGSMLDVMTPRDLIAIAKYDTRVRAATKQKSNEPLLFAIESGFLGRLTATDKQKAKEFVTRVVA